MMVASRGIFVNFKSPTRSGTRSGLLGSYLISLYDFEKLITGFKYKAMISDLRPDV